MCLYDWLVCCLLEASLNIRSLKVIRTCSCKQIWNYREILNLLSQVSLCERFLTSSWDSSDKESCDKDFRILNYWYRLVSKKYLRASVLHSRACVSMPPEYYYFFAHRFKFQQLRCLVNLKFSCFCSIYVCVTTMPRVKNSTVPKIIRVNHDIKE